MKLDEINFFNTCYKYRNNGVSIREIINILKFFINYKRCWYLLKKWSGLGFLQLWCNIRFRMVWVRKYAIEISKFIKRGKVNIVEEVKFE